MAVTLVKKGIVIIFMVMLVVTQAHDITPSTQVEPKVGFVCRAKCFIKCSFLKRGPMIAKCVDDCLKQCNGMSSNNVSLHH